MSGLLEAARALGPLVRARASDGEHERRLPTELVDAFADAGLWGLCVPRTLGGAEASPAELIEVFEEVSRADGSAGWCVMIGASSGIVSGWLPEEGAKEVYGDPRSVTGGALAPNGVGTRVDGGVRVSGRWPFASGCQHCSWLMGTTIVDDGGILLTLFPASDVTIHDTWTVSGLRGTGSHDIEVRDVFVPSAHAAVMFGASPREPGPLYAYPLFGLLATSIASVPLGIARRAIDELVELAAGKTPVFAGRRLAERATAQEDVARSEAALRAARALLLEATASAWDEVVASGEASLRTRAVLRAACTHAAWTSAGVVDAMYNAGGGTSVYASSALQRCFRDVHAATQHIMVQRPTWETAGRVLMGVETDTSML